MGAVCGKEDHFDSLGSGNTLARAPTPHQPRQKPIAPRSQPQPAAQRLGGGGEGSATGEGGPDREAMLRAAEKRSKAAESRGKASGGGGSLSKKLEQQKRDGGRREEAEAEADRRGNQPLVWD
ncbi:uncharacterized protein JCM6883_004091 [Sporobolomyces salmoneus]|uniref:uncharacterized protein n=1 Tax=Sporobolomyces salmoneus TaxID=183962 RepID=UPI003182585C